MNDQPIYDDSVIEVILLSDDKNESIKHVALKYKTPKNYFGKEGTEVKVTNVMGGESDWFILPHTFGISVGKKLFEQFSTGLNGFNDKGIEVLKKWLIEIEAIDDAMCY